MDYQKFLNEINNNESKYQANNYNGITKSGDFKIRKSKTSIPVMLSAPHAVKQFRNDSIKEEEDFTGSLVEMLGEKFDLNYIIKTKNINDDANWDVDSQYKIDLENFIQQNNIKMLIDIHGASKSRPFDIEIGTNHGVNINHQVKLVEIFKKIANLYHINNIAVDETFTASNIRTVSRYINDKTNIICMQLEINKIFRNPNENIENFSELFHILNHFIYVANEYLQSEEQYIDILEVKQTQHIEPTNRVELSQAQLDSFQLKNLQNIQKSPL